MFTKLLILRGGIFAGEKIIFQPIFQRLLLRVSFYVIPPSEFRNFD